MPAQPFDIQTIREDFPVLSHKVYDKDLIYFDNGATTQKPLAVINKIREIYSESNSSIHRGVHYLSTKMTTEYENARETVRGFINAKSSSEIIFTSGATASVNLLAFSFGEKYIKEGDEIIISEMEHHSNIVPWQLLCERKKARLRILPMTGRGELQMDIFDSLLSEKTRLVSIVHVSNSLGTINPVEEIIRKAHARDIPVMLDGAQAIQHGKVDVQALGADFYVFSGHKVFGPTGTGVLYGREKILDKLPPWQGGGDMVDCVKFEKTTFNSLPFKFEAGTTNYAGSIALAEALKYIKGIGIDNIARHEMQLLHHLHKTISEIEGIRIFGTSSRKIPVVSFLVDSIHPYDVGMILDKMGIAVRTGTHCTQPVMDHFEIPGTIRASLAFYNTQEETERFIEGLRLALNMLR